ncbi:MAG TPA: Lrp/AsnC ligand binding domain-containing protein [Nitrospiria bacterium]|jgi:DNA-binding Lrp family transcriptional regulator
MAAAYILMNVQSGKVGKALNAVKRIQGVRSAHIVAGAYDIIGYVEAEDFESLGQRIMFQVQSISGIRGTNTAVVFQ